MKDAFFEDFCEKVFTLNKQIRFVGLADGSGDVLAVKYPKRMKQESGEITDVDIARGLLPQVLQVGLYHRVTKYAGQLRYQIGTFDRLHIVSIPITYNPKDSFFLILSIESESDPVKLIQDHLVPLIESNRDYLL